MNTGMSKTIIHGVSLGRSIGKLRVHLCRAFFLKATCTPPITPFLDPNCDLHHLITPTPSSR